MYCSGLTYYKKGSIPIAVKLMKGTETPHRGNTILLHSVKHTAYEKYIPIAFMLFTVYLTTLSTAQSYIIEWQDC
jgi:hypothetical protein